MNASETSLQSLLEGKKQYRVPLFQRTYSWRSGHWRTLWNDIIETYAMTDAPRHFLGSIVSKSLPGKAEGIAPFLVIDGQQRLTTLTILLAALRDVARSVDEQLTQEIHEDCLTNRWVTGENRFRMLPTQADRPAYAAVIDGTADVFPDSLVVQAHKYFRSRLMEPDPEGNPLNLRRLHQVILNGLELVSINLDERDNEYRIFESLNFKGERLTQADLLRNYFFMRLPLGQLEGIYNRAWLPMQELLGNALESFFRVNFMLKGNFVREGDVYQVWKRHLDTLSGDEVFKELTKIAERARFYKRMLDPQCEPEPRIRAAMLRLNRWGSQTTHPFLLHVYLRYQSEDATLRITTDEFVKILRMVESFLVRRTFLNIPTNQLNRLFLRLAHQLPENVDFVSGVRSVLSEPSRRWPTDDEFAQAILTYPLYVDSRPDQRRLILESLVECLGHHETVGLANLTIEHVMPQTLTPEWREALGPDCDDIHRRLVHTLGNLTLTGYNPELSNSPFSYKRQLLRESNLQVNREIASHANSTESEIIERGRQLAERAINIWPGPLR